MKILLEAASRDAFKDYLPKESNGEVSPITIKTLRDNGKEAPAIYMEMINQWNDKNGKILTGSMESVVVQSCLLYEWEESQNLLLQWCMTGDSADFKAAGNEGFELVFQMIRDGNIRKGDVDKYLVGTNLFEPSQAVYKLKVLNIFLSGQNNKYQDENGVAVQLDDIMDGGKFLPAKEIRTILDKYESTSDSSADSGTVKEALSKNSVPVADVDITKKFLLSKLTEKKYVIPKLLELYKYRPKLNETGVRSRLDELTETPEKYNKLLLLPVADVSDPVSLAYAIYMKLDGTSDDLSRPGLFVTYTFRRNNKLKPVIHFNDFKLNAFKQTCLMMLNQVKNKIVVTHLEDIKNKISTGYFDVEFNKMMTQQFSVRNNLYADFLRKLIEIVSKPY